MLVFFDFFSFFFDLGEERLGYLSPRSGKAVEFNQVSVSFCFRIDGTFFFLKQGQHLRKNEKVFFSGFLAREEPTLRNSRGRP